MVEFNWEQFAEECQQAYDKSRAELTEIEMLIQQTSSEVDRLTQTNSRAVAKTRQMEATFDTFPREDIRRIYESLIENQQRLFTMRGQLEKLQSDKKHLTTITELYRAITSSRPTSTFASSPSMTGSSATVVPSAQNIIVSVIEAQEMERLRLSRQMHDGPAQRLTNMVLQAEIVERLFDRDLERAKVELAELKENVETAFKAVKVFIFDLRPMMLDDLGLVPTLRRYVDGITSEGFSGLTLQISGKERRMASHKEITMFRVIQALIHIGREQSRAEKINVHLSLEDDEARIDYEDNGTGFELDKELTSEDAINLNLPMLRDRIEMLGGAIEFRSKLQKGMVAAFTLPTPIDEL